MGFKHSITAHALSKGLDKKGGVAFVKSLPVFSCQSHISFSHFMFLIHVIFLFFSADWSIAHFVGCLW